MELLPISASLGAMGSLAGKLDPDTELKNEVSKVTTRLLRLLKARDPPVTAGIWMKGVRELSYDMENCVDLGDPDWIGLEARVKEVNKQYDMYMLGDIPICTNVFPIIDHRRKKDPVVIGLHDKGGAVDKLRPWLTDDGVKELKVVSIVGARGIGKTTLAKQLWRDTELGEFNCRAFVRTARKPDMRRILRSILAQVRPDPPPDSNEVHELIQGLREHLRDKRYFLIIDDLWAKSVWDIARRAFPEGNGSRILITTEFENVALACCSYHLGYIFNMKPLSPSHSKELLRSGMFGYGEEQSREQVIDEVIRRCGGLPLAIISISNVIASQGEVTTGQNRQQIQDYLPTNTTPDDILKQVLNFCYNCLPSGLQTCLLYLSLYPENYIILKQDIMKQWVAEGFILALTENEKMKVAGDYFDKLVDLGMIQQIDVDYGDEVLDYNDNVLYYAVHRMVHDLITSKSTEQNFLNVIDYSQRTVRFSNKVNRLSLQFGSATYASTPSSVGLSHVRSLAFIGLESCFPPISEFKLLRYLTLHMWADQPSTGVDLKPTSELVLLRSLQMTCNATVHLPDLIEGPIHLETLEINARVAAIPDNIVHLRRWLHLRLGVGTEMPDVTGILKNVTMNPPISLDESSSPPNSVTTIDLLSPISRIPKWVRDLTNLCILKFVVRELQSDCIINLQRLPFLAVLSLRVQRRTRELIRFATGAFTALEYFEFRCGVLCLAFEEGAMPNLQRVKLGFNAHRGEQYSRFLVGIKDMLSIQKISVLIGSAAGAAKTDLDAAESAFKEAIGRYHSKPIIKRSDMAEEEFDPPEQEQDLITFSELPGHGEDTDLNILDTPGEYPSASSEQPRLPGQDQPEQDIVEEQFDPPEQEQDLITFSEFPGLGEDTDLNILDTRGEYPSASSEQPRVPGQDQPEQQHSIERQHPSSSSEQPPQQVLGTYSQSIRSMPPSGAPSSQNNRPKQSAAIPRKNRQSSKAERPMAYLPLRLAKAMVEGSLSKAQAAILVQAKLPQSARRDMMFITDEFTMMRSILNRSEDYIENELVQTWVKQMHELAYSVEDCMELVALLDKEKRSLRRRVRRLCLPCAPVKMRALDQAVDKIEQLKARVEDVSSRSLRYNLVSNTESIPVVVQQKLEAAAGGGIAASNMLAEARENASRELNLGGRDLTKLITHRQVDEDDLQVISVWGSGGDHGTASIIMKTYGDPEICSNFACRAWLKLVYPFSPQDLILRFMLQFCAAEYQEAAIRMDVLNMMQYTQEDLFMNFRKIVTEKRYLVVLEGMSNMEEWHSIRNFLPGMRNGSCIIISTQQDEIASLCFEQPYQILELKQFSAEHSICALFKKGSKDYRDKKLALSQVTQNLSYGKTTSSSWEAADYWMKNYPLVGRESEMKELLGHTARARFNNSPVVSVCGIAGIGKSVLVKHLYFERMMHTNLFNKYYWVDVSHPFNLRHFCRCLLSDHHSEKDPIKECHELLSQHNCLVVIDDLQSKEEWDLIRAALVSRPCESLIIVITTEASIAAYCTTDEQQVFKVKALESAAAMDLFRKEAQRKNPGSPLSYFRSVEMDELILKCGGLPKVIVSLAAILATQTVTVMDTVRLLNRNFVHHMETNPEYDSLQGIFDLLHSYFHTCPDSLKPCIFYLSIFPRGHNIRRRRLAMRWIAEGYSRDSEEESAVEKGENFFSQLLDLSIIQQIPQLVTTASSDARMVSCQVNGFIGEYIISRRTENLVFVLGPNCVLTTQRTGHHLTILGSWDRDRILFESIDLSQLRSLTVFGQWKSFFISSSMSLLRVLDLEDTLGVKDADLKKLVQQLPRLKFLSLRGCIEIFRLPSSLGNLRQLQTLDVRHTSILTLPASITKLHELQYIRAGTSFPPSTMSASSRKFQIFRRTRSVVGVDVPRGIGKQMALHTLGVVNVSASGGKAVIQQLKKLTQLRKLGVSGINRHNGKDFISAISGHVHLESLSVQLDEESHGWLDDISLPWENLQSLKLYGLQQKLPLSRSQLNKLRKLDLEMATLKRNDIEFLANLPELCILRLRLNRFEYDSLHFYAELYGVQLPTFQKVKILEISCTSGQSLNVDFGSKSMKNLELLKLDCSGAPYQLKGLEYLSELKQVLLRGADEEIKTALEKRLHEYHPETAPSVKLE